MPAGAPYNRIMRANRRAGEGHGIDIGLGGIAPILVAAGLVAVRSHVANVNVALVLALVVAAAGAVGGRAAGAVSALTAAASFDFFHTRPYLSLLIHDRDDVEMTVILLVVGLLAAQLARPGRVAARAQPGGPDGLDRVRLVADQVAAGRESVDVIAAARAELIALLDLVGCRFEPAPFETRRDLPHLERNGCLAGRRYLLQPGRELMLELPETGMAVPVTSRGREIVGRFVLLARPGTGATLEQRVVAVAIADQVGASLAAYPQPVLTR
jgi:hypothetical protein